jgi:bacteriocin biosynthesis cyclodehydratase domain-containing protein
MSMAPRRPRLALPFTILTSRDTVRLVAGEDFRYTLTGPELDAWLPGWLAGLDGRGTLDEALGRLPEVRRGPARSLADRLYGERVLIDGTAVDAHAPARWQLAVEGSAAWAAGWHPGLVGRTTASGEADGNVCPTRVLPVLCQDRLDHDEALRFNRRCLDGGTPWLWASTGPMSRAYVGPLFLPDAGPCWSCLLYHFRRLSPAPELYEALADHARSGRALTRAPFPAPAVALLRQLLLWKAELAEAPEAPAALYRLHALEVATLEVTSHRVFVDPECPECSGRR